MDPEEIENRQFLVTLRGYARDEVEAFREELAQEIRLLRKQLTKATSELSHTSGELERVQGELAQARAQLDEQSRAPVQEAVPADDKASIFKLIGQETERILLAAEQAAEQMHERAVKESAEMLADARARVQRSMEELEAARRAAEEDFAEITGVRNMVASQMEDIGRRLEETINRLRVPVELPGPKSARTRQVQQSQATERLLAGGNALKQAESDAQRRRQRELEAARELAARQTAHLAQVRQREEELQAVQSEAERRRAEAERQAREQEATAARREQEARAAAAAAEAERLKAAREADQRAQEEAERRAREQQEEESRAAAQQAARAEAERLARLEAEAAAAAEAERVARAEAEKQAQQEAERVARTETAPAAAAAASGGKPAVAAEPPAEPKPSAHEAAEPAQTAAEKSSSLDALLEEIRRKREEGTAAPPPEPAPESPVGTDEIAKRNDALGDLPPQTARRLKRLLQEDHNDLLDRLRKQRGKGSVEDNLAPLEDQVQRFSSGLNEPLSRAFSEGRKAAGARSGGEPGAAVQRLISRQVVNPLRSEVSKAVSAGLEDEESASALSERVNDVFRVWKGVRTQLLGEGIAHSAYHQGLLDALGSIADAKKTWVLADDEQDCPNDVCRRNADAGPVELRSAFPSGHLAPPAHGGCTCTLKGS